MAVTIAARELVFADGSSHKFWKITLDGSSHTVNFGRVGTQGQSQTKDFSSEAEAKKSYDKLVAEKLKKGYADIAGAEGSAEKKIAEPVSSQKDQAADASNSPSTAKQRTAKNKPPVPVVEESSSKASAPKEDVDLSTPRQIDLDPEDWFRARFRARERLEKGVPRDFDKEASLQKLSQLRTTGYGWDVRWEDLRLPRSLSREEAHFWLVATTSPRKREDTMKSLAEKLADQKFDGKVKLAAARKLVDASRSIAEETCLALANLLAPLELVEWMLTPPNNSKQSWEHAANLKELLAGFNKFVLPYLDDAALEEVRQRVRKTWNPAQIPHTNFEAFPAEYYFAAMLGMHDEVYEIVSSWPDERYLLEPWTDHYQSPQDLLFGLGTAQLVEAEWRRLKLKFRSPSDVRGFLACTEYSALDCVAESILAETSKEKCEELVKTLTLVRAPEAALPLLQVKLGAKTPAIARDWLDKNVGLAVLGLVDVAGGRGKLADAALGYLRGIKRRGYASWIAECLEKSQHPEAAAKVRVEVLEHEEKTYPPCDETTTPAWLSEALASLGKVKSTKLPAWASPAALSPIVVGEVCLNEQQFATVLQVLAATPVTQRHPLLLALREQVSATVRDEFAWSLFQRWLEDGYPSKEKWAMAAIGHLGADHSVLKLTPLIRNWPGESQHARAVFGLECLRAIGSSTALMQLASIAQKLKFKGLKAKAQQFVEEIAQERGLTRDELEDRVVPDCGLDENGRREFSFGPRSFAFVLGSDLKAMVRDQSGKLRPNLPEPGAKDDAAIASESVAEWKLLKKQIKEVATIQAGRLEQAMVTGRRWKVDDFAALLVRHPLMTHLAQKLIWGGFDAKGKRLATLRVTEERDYADADDNTSKLEGVSAIGLIHPLELSEQERARWGEVMSDYEIVAPFPQLGRAVHSLEAGEESDQELKRYHELQVVAPTLVFTLEKLGWTRGVAMDGGCFDEHSKQFPAANVTAVVGYEGSVGMGYIDPNEMLITKSVHFCQGMRPPSGYGWGSKDNQMLKLSDVPPIVISEVIADLQVLKSKAK